MLSLRADYQLHGIHAGGYHLTNIALHAASAILLLLALRIMTGAIWTSAFAAAVFAIHPLRAESVAWIAERKDVLSGFFFMLTLLAYVNYTRKARSAIRYLLLLGAFALALMCKPSVVTVPFLLLLLDYWPLQRTQPISKLILEKIPLAALAAVSCVLTLMAAKEGIAARASVPLASRLGNAVVSYGIYLRQMVWPENLTAFYPSKPHPAWAIVLSILFMLGITALVWAFRKNHRWLVTGWFWYLGMLLPMIGIVQAGEFAHADRMTYLSQIGLYLAVIWTAAEFFPGERTAHGIVMAAIVGALSLTAFRQTGFWKNGETLWTHALECTQGNYVAYSNLGSLQLNQGKVDDALQLFEQGLRAQPRSPNLHINMGNALFQKGAADEAMEQFRQAIAYDPANVIALDDLGVVDNQTGRQAEAIASFQRVLTIEPNDIDALSGLAQANAQIGKISEAVAQFSKILEIQPGNFEVLNNLAWLLATSRNESIRDAKRALKLSQQANELTDGKGPLIHHTLAAAFANLGQFDEAKAAVQQAIDLAQASGRPQLIPGFKTELQSYEEKKPLRQ